MLRPRQRDALLQIPRPQAVDRAGRFEPARLDADHLPVGRTGRGVVRLRGQHLRARRGKPRLRLRHVGAGDLADLEAILGLPQLLLQHLDVAALQAENRGVADQVHVGGRGRKQHGLLAQPQRLACRRNQLLRLPGARCRPVAVEQRLRVGRAVGLRSDVADRTRIADDARGGRAFRSRVEELLANRRREADARPIAGERLRHALVGGAHLRALRIKLRIVLIGLGQRAAHGVGVRERRRKRTRDKRTRARRDDEHPQPDACPPHRSPNAHVHVPS
jgi:hypothetical protein